MSQFEDYLRDWGAVRRDEKPMMICERRKSPAAYAHIRHHTDTSFRIMLYDIMLADSAGTKHAAIAVTCRPARFHSLIALLETRDCFTREVFQLQVGRLLGYTDESCKEYSASLVGETCGCELCGGESPEGRALARQRREDHIRRTMYHA